MAILRSSAAAAQYGEDTVVDSNLIASMAYGVQRLAGDAWGSWRHLGSLGAFLGCAACLLGEPVLASVLRDASCQSRVPPK